MNVFVAELHDCFHCQEGFEPTMDTAVIFIWDKNFDAFICDSCYSNPDNPYLAMNE